MQLFLDSADPQVISKHWQLELLDGLTTNPSLAAQTSRPYPELVSEILEVVSGPVSLEVIATDYDGIIEQAHRLHQLAENVVVKIPCIPAGLKAAKQLNSENIATNVTLVFTANQALLAAKAGATYVSPFIGRVNDREEGAGYEMLQDIVYMYHQYQFETKVLAASIRSANDVRLAAQIGADVVTIPEKIFEEMFTDPLTDKGLKAFLDDWHAANLELPN